MTERVDLPVACSLTAAEQADRLQAFRDLARRALADRRRDGDRVVLSFHATRDVASRVEDFARRERECCPFLDLSVRHGDLRVVLSIGAGPEAAPMLDAFYELADSAPGTRPAGRAPVMDTPH